jgi:hypothetical protein
VTGNHRGSILAHAGVIGVLAWALAGCTSVQPAGSVDAATPSAVPDSSDTAPSPSPTATPRPTAPPTPKPSPAVDALDPWFRFGKHEFIDGVDGQLIAPVKNIGSTWVRMLPGQSDYTVYNSDGTVAGTGYFLYAYPAYIAPGETGYFPEDVQLEGADVDLIGKVEPNIYFEPVSEDDAIVFTTDKVTNKYDSLASSVTTTGTLTNTSSEAVESGHVGAFYLDGNGAFLGFSTTNLIQQLGAGQTKGFETLSFSKHDFTDADVAETIVWASASY